MGHHRICIRFTQCCTRGLLLSLTAVLFTPICGTTGLAKDTWLTVKGPHVTALTNVGEKKTRRLVREFEQFRTVFRTAFPGVLVDADRPIVMFAVKNKKQFRDLIPQSWRESEAAGYFLRGPDKHHILLRTDVGFQAYHAVYHEYVHFLVSLNLVDVPLWLDEGLAEVWSHIEFKKEEVKLGLPAEEHLRHLNRNSLLPLDILFSVDHSSPHYSDQDKTGLFYSQSWALTHLLLLGDEVRRSNLLGRFVELLKEEDLENAYDEVFGDLQGWEKLLEDYVGKGIYGYLKIQTSIDFEEESLAAAPLTEAQVLSARGHLLLQAGQLEDALSLFDSALALDQENPSAWEGRGLGTVRSGNYEESLPFFEKAVDCGSESFLSHYYLATLGTDSELAANKIEKGFLNSIRLNPRFAPAYSGLATWYMSQDTNLEEALKLSRKACNLEPDELTHLENVIIVLMRLEKLKEAEVLANHLLRSAASDLSKENARHYLEQLRFLGNPSLTEDPSVSLDTPPQLEPQPAPTSESSSADEFEVSQIEETRRTGSEFSAPGRNCLPYFVSVRGIVPIPAKLLSLECGDPVIFVTEINGVLTRLVAADPSLPVLFSCDIKMQAVQCGSFEHPANVYMAPEFDKDPNTGAMRVLAIEFKKP